MSRSLGNVVLEYGSLSFDLRSCTTAMTLAVTAMTLVHDSYEARRDSHDWLLTTVMVTISTSSACLDSGMPGCLTYLFW